MEGNEEQNNSLSRLRLTKQPRVASAPLVVDETTGVWEIYNDRATTIDRELIKDWNDSLNTLLIFAALYSAVLTAFIIESMKLLQEDVTETTRDILIAITKQLANDSVNPFEPEPFTAPAYAVRVNYYFFLSISFSLVAALASVLALQWVGSYDAGLNQSSPEERALQRHFRYQGIEKWKMGNIIAFLPSLVFIALFLFFIGLAEWMWVLHRGIAGVVIAGLVCGASFFIITTMISMVYIGAPFRTPPSRSLPQLFIGAYFAIFKVLSQFSIGSMLKTIQGTPSLFIAVHSGSARAWNELRSLGTSLYRYIKSPHLLEAFEVREELEIKAVTDRKRAALMWLITQVSILPNTASHFRVIINEILQLPSDQLVEAPIQEAPWRPIFKILLEPYLKQDRLHDLPSEEATFMIPIFHILSMLWKLPMHLSTILNGINSSNVTVKSLVSMGAYKHELLQGYHTIPLLNILKCAPSTPTNVIVAHMLSLRRHMRLRSTTDFETLSLFDVEELAMALSGSLSNSASFHLPKESIDLLYELFAYIYTGKTSDEPPIEQYLTGLRIILKESAHPVMRRAIDEIHGGIIIHLVRFIHANDTYSTLEQLGRLLWSKPSSMSDRPTIAAILNILRQYWSTWEVSHRLTSTYTYASIMRGTDHLRRNQLD